MSRDLALWTGLLAGPTVWLMSFEALFALNPWACIFQTKLALYAVSLGAFVISGAAGLVAWNQWKILGSQLSAETGGALARSRMMAFGGIILSVFSCLIIVAQAIPELVLESCQ